MKNIILVGFMGCGKTTVGKELAKILGMTFVDTDELIEQKFKMSISEYFSKYGEEDFRKQEAIVFSEIMSKGGKIISTGGGLPIYLADKSVFKDGFTVYLQISPRVVVERLENDKTRPLLQGEDKLKKVSDLMDKRAPIYQQIANITINSENSVKNIINLLLLEYNSLE